MFWKQKALEAYVRARLPYERALRGSLRDWWAGGSFQPSEAYALLLLLLE